MFLFLVASNLNLNLTVFCDRNPHSVVLLGQQDWELCALLVPENVCDLSKKAGVNELKLHDCTNCCL